MVEILKELDGQQDRLVQMQTASVRARNVRRTSQLAKIRQNHEERQTEMLADLDRQFVLELEEALYRLQQEEEAKHSVTLKTLLDRITETKTRIGKLQQQMDGITEVASVDQIEAQELEELPQMELPEEDQAQLSKLSRNWNLRSVSDRTLLQPSAASTGDRDDVASALVTKVSTQSKVLDLLAQVLRNRQMEADQLEAEMEEERAQYAAETREFWQRNLSSNSRRRAAFEEEYDLLQKEFTDKISLLKAKIEFAEQNSRAIQKECDLARAHELENVQMTLRIAQEERSRVFRDNHDHVFAQTTERRHQLQETHAARMDAIQKRVLQTVAEQQVESNQKREMLECNKTMLLEAAQLLEAQFVELGGLECQECAKKRAMIMTLLERRSELASRKEASEADAQVTEEHMNDIFGASTAASEVRAPSPLVRSSQSVAPHMSTSISNCSLRSIEGTRSLVMRARSGLTRVLSVRGRPRLSSS
jgi:hypothetical protein